MKMQAVLGGILLFALMVGIGHYWAGAQQRVNDPPVAIDAHYSTPGRMMVVSVEGRGGQGPLRVELVSQPMHGKAEMRKPSSIKYSPQEGFAGWDSFTFRVVDARGVTSKPATVTVEVTPRGDMDYSPGIRFDPPPHIEKIGASTSRLFRLGYLDVTLYDGWEGHRVDPTGQKDSTTALQKAIDDGYDYQLAVFFPAGTYTVSDTLRVVKKRARFATYHCNTLVGSTKGRRPVIRLAANATGFDDPKAPKPVVWVWTNREGYNRSFGTPAHEFSTSQEQQWASMGFTQSVENLIIDCNGSSGNAGAIGLRFAGAQASDVHNVKVIATGAFAGIYDIPSRSSAGAANIEVEGGRFGLYLENGASSVIVGAVLRNQTEAAFYSTHFPPVAMVGFHIIKESGPVITVRGAGWSRAVGTMSLMDGIIELRDGGPALDNSVGRNLYARNVYVTGTDEVVRTPKGTLTASGTWKRIREVALVDQYAPEDDPPYESGDRNFASSAVVDGEIRKNGLVDIESASSAPPADLVGRHVWETLPSFEDDDCVVLTEVTDADGSDDKDDWAAMQQAIDEHEQVFVPKGLFRVGRTLRLRAKTKLFGISRPLARIYSHPSWKPTAEATIIETVDDAEATTYLGTPQLGFQWGEKQHDWFNLVHWRAGRKSMVMGVTDRHGAEDRRTDGSADTNPHSLWKITGNGGGRWYFWGVDKSGPNDHPEYRHLLIDGTRQPLWLYGCNLEKGLGLTRCEIRNARNVRVFSVKIETRRPIFRVHDSENIAIFSSGAMRNHCVGYPGVGDSAYYWITGRSRNVLLANINPQTCGRGEGSFTLLEDTAFGRTGLNYPAMLAVYKRGEIDDATMWP